MDCEQLGQLTEPDPLPTSDTDETTGYMTDRGCNMISMSFPFQDAKIVYSVTLSMELLESLELFEACFKLSVSPPPQNKPNVDMTCTNNI